jgi:hypothetical protein
MRRPIEGESRLQARRYGGCQQFELIVREVDLTEASGDAQLVSDGILKKRDDPARPSSPYIFHA